MDGRVTLEEGDAQRLPYVDEAFDGAYSQHVTMNSDRESFFAEAWRVLKPGGYFGLTERGLGDASQGGTIQCPGPKTAPASTCSHPSAPLHFWSLPDSPT
jgi:ubiquinone/menaquinone biosynthesis C-methylase UbiE